ncbi:hypothetical protein HY633_05245 [Candidatus Uhrbacteria bacterium]|nr:hypothetical protein [Candidatus Uhrbacteria bacterium]
MASITARTSLTRVGGVIFAFLIIPFFSCRGCEDLSLYATTCEPGAPAHGEPNGKPEVCKNGLDDNCDGRIDEDCECNSDVQPADTMDCGGDGHGRDIGACKVKTVTCVNGKFPGCEPDRWPDQYRDTTCDGIDDDCDGQTDEEYVALDCWTGREDAVFSESSVCKKGKIACLNGRPQPCGGQTLPSAEHCNNRDDDCDGEVDELTAEAGAQCGPERVIGQCRRGRKVCTTEGEVLCDGADYGADESCDGIDNDCDGRTDEGIDGQPLIERCETRSPEGRLCEVGFTECLGGHQSVCSARAYEPIDTCDGVDNDCDGEIDEDVPCPCRPGIDFKPCKQPPMTGAPDGMMCGLGIQECIEPPECDPAFPESCIPRFGDCEFWKIELEDCNLWDDDCDGEVDEDDNGDPLAAYCGHEDNPAIGECHLGNTVCVLGVWGPCEGEVMPKEEVCDNKDNDCDNEVDEDLNPHDKVDVMFLVDVSGSMQDKINAMHAAMGRWSGEFTNTEHRFGLASVPGDMGITTPWTVITQPTDIASFQAALAALNAGGGSEEPSYDALYDAAALFSSPASTMVQWRADAYPYVIFVGDEPAQWWPPRNLTESQVASVMTNCRVGICQPGDKVEVFLFIDRAYELQYDEIVYYETVKRIYPLIPVDEDRFVRDLQKVFKDVCPPSNDGGVGDGGSAADGGSSSSGAPDGGP